MTEHLFIAGAQRSATSYLYRMLDQHPAIEMAKPVRPEPKYFIRNNPVMDADNYRREFFRDPQANWYGEKSTSYIEHPLAAERISRLFPNARIIFMLRDPVGRALSNYRFSVENGLETLSLEDALEQERNRVPRRQDTSISVSPFAYVGRGHYVHYLDQWVRWFSKEQIDLLTTESIVGSELGIRGLFERLGIDTSVPLNGIGERVNHSSPETEDFPQRLVDRLREEFKSSNKQLQLRYGVDTSAWQ